MSENGVVSQAYETTLRVLQSVMSSRAEWAAKLGKAFGGKRDYYETLGYDRFINPEDYYRVFKRQDIASRIVTAYPDDTWRLRPIIYEDEAPADTVFEQEWDRLVRDHQVYHQLHRADVQACLYRYSVIYLGFNDAMTVEQLASEVSNQGERRLIQVVPYGERNVEILELDNDITSPRFGKPLIYEIDFSRKNEENQKRVDLGGTRKHRVHWTRVVHIADGCLEDDVYGTPKLEAVWNLLHDMQKVVGGGAEMFWRAARRDLILQTQENANFTEEALKKARSDAEDYVHELNRILGLEGIDVKTLPIEVASPKDHVESIAGMIAGTTGIPQRKFFGSERGELASTQDDENWAQKIITRQTVYADPTILRQVIDRLISYRVLPTPRGGPDAYTVEWQPLIVESPDDRADRATKLANAWNTLASGMALDIAIPLPEARVEIFGLDPESPYAFPDVEDATESDAMDDDIEEDEDESGSDADE